MARINVEQKALTDPRFRLVGNFLSAMNSAPKELIESAVGLILSVRVWNLATDFGSDTLDANLVEGIYDGLCQAMIDAKLLDDLGDGSVRVRGWTDAGCGWLQQKRESAQSGGLERAKTAKRSTNGRFLKENIQRPPAGEPATLDQPAPAGASALTPALALREEGALQNGSIEQHEAAFIQMPFPVRFRSLAKRYPHRAPANRAEAAWKLAVKTEDDAIAIELGADAWMACEQWQAKKGIPSLANFIGEGWWKDYPDDSKPKSKAQDQPKLTDEEIIANINRDAARCRAENAKKLSQ